MQSGPGRLLRILTTLLLALAIGNTADGQSVYSLEFLADLNLPTGAVLEVLAGHSKAGGAGSNAGSLTPVESETREVVLSRKASGEFGGISGIAYDASSKLLYALSDSTNPTVFVFELELVPGTLRLRPHRVIRLTDEDGGSLPLWTLDPEGIVLQESGRLLIVSEGFVLRAPPVQPGIFEFSADGKRVGSHLLPAHFLRPPDGSSRGVQPNLGPEGLSLSPNGKQLFIATEGPLAQDLEGVSEDRCCRARILAYAFPGLDQKPMAEYIYRFQAPEAPDDFGPAPRSMGLSEILALDDRNLLTLERGFSRASDGRAHQVIRIFHVELPAGPADNAEVLEKRLVLDVGTVVNRFTEGFRSLDNYEGMCLGPRLPDGSRTVLIASDNNYSERQRTSFVAFRLKK